MSEEDLMIGDWVEIVPYQDESKKYYTRIENGRDLDAVFDFLGCVEPVIITSERLRQNGFNRVRFSKGEYTIGLQDNNANGQIWINYSFNPRSLSIVLRKCYKNAENELVYIDEPFLRVEKLQYVHELQHALKLCKIDKEIEL